MSLAQKLKAQGRQEGRQEGILVGQIQLLEKFLGRTTAGKDELALLSLAELEARFAGLEAEYEARFKGR